MALVPVLLLGALGIAAHAQETDSSVSRQAPVFRSTTSLVALNVIVTNGREFVSGLQRDDFAVFEDGVQQDVRFFEAREVPLDLVLLLDTSSSMRHRMKDVHTAAINFVNTLREQDQGAIVTFASSVQVTQPLTTDKAALRAAIQGAEGDGGTALHNALYIALRQFAAGTSGKAGEEVRRQAFAVLSDGHDTTSLLSFDDVLEEARRSRATIYTINLRPEHEPHTAELARQTSMSQFAMRRLAQETGGQAFFATDAWELRHIYDGIAAELSSQYAVGYAPSNTKADGRLRRILVRVISRPELRARARTGYVVEASRLAGATRSGAD
jgi:Ca-activated chloride channel homolog